MLGGNILQKALDLALNKRGHGFSDKLPKRILSCLQALKNEDVVHNMIIHTNCNGDSALHISARHKKSSELFNMMLRLLSKQMKRHIHAQNKDGLTPLMLLIKNETVSATYIQDMSSFLIPNLSWEDGNINILNIANSCGEDYLLATVKHLENQENELVLEPGSPALKLIITNDRCVVMRYVREQFTASLHTRLRTPEFQIWLRELTFTVRMRDEILKAEPDANERVRLSGLITPKTCPHDTSVMQAIIFCNDEDDSRANTELLSATFCSACSVSSPMDLSYSLL